MDDLVTVESREVILEPLRRYCALVFSPETLESLSLDIQNMPGRIGKQLTAMLDLPMEPLKEVTETTSYKTPLTWFDHLRAEHFPRFLAIKWPIRWNTMEIPVTIKIGAVYPELPMNFKKAGPIRYYTSKPYGISRQHPAPKEEDY